MLSAAVVEGMLDIYW